MMDGNMADDKCFHHDVKLYVVESVCVRSKVRAHLQDNVLVALLGCHGDQGP